MHVVDVASARLLPDTIGHVGEGTSPTALAWDADGKGFVHTQFSRDPAGTYATSSTLLYHHELGSDPSNDAYVFGKGRSPRSEYTLQRSHDGRVLAVTAADGAGVHAALLLRDANGPLRQVAVAADGIGNTADPGGAFVGDAFYAISTKRDSRPPASPECSCAASSCVARRQGQDPAGDLRPARYRPQRQGTHAAHGLRRVLHHLAPVLLRPEPSVARAGRRLRVFKKLGWRLWAPAPKSRPKKTKNASRN